MECGANDGADLVVVHDQLGELGGSERVVAAILERFPAAELVAPRFVTTNCSSGPPPAFEARARVAWNGGRRRHFLAPVYARRIARVPLDGARVVLSTAGMGWSLAARVPRGARHVAYVTGVPRLLQGDAPKYLLDYPRPLRPLLAATVPLLRADLRRLMRRPDRVLTNSAWSASAVREVFGVHAHVVHPPVRTHFFTPEPRARRHALVVARLVPHKRIDVVLEAFRALDLELVVAGGGAWLERLRATAPANVRFTGCVSDEELRELYRASVVLIHASVEEFGIAMAEANACGTPVIAPRAGGALEIVRDGETGILLERVDAAGIATAVRRLSERPLAADTCRASSLRFTEERFVAAIERVVAQELELARSAASRPLSAGAAPGLPSCARGPGRA